MSSLSILTSTIVLVASFGCAIAPTSREPAQVDAGSTDLPTAVAPVRSPLSPNETLVNELATNFGRRRTLAESRIRSYVSTASIAQKLTASHDLVLNKMVQEIQRDGVAKSSLKGLECQIWESSYFTHDAEVQLQDLQNLLLAKNDPRLYRWFLGLFWPARSDGAALILTKANLTRVLNDNHKKYCESHSCIEFVRQEVRRQPFDPFDDRAMLTFKERNLSRIAIYADAEIESGSCSDAELANEEVSDGVGGGREPQQFVGFPLQTPQGRPNFFPSQRIPPHQPTAPQPVQPRASGFGVAPPVAVASPSPSPTLAPVAAGPAFDWRHRHTGGGRMQPGEFTITYDDGPHPEYTPKLAQLWLDSGFPKPAFFWLSTNVQANTQIGRNVHAAGFLIGSHSRSHANIELLATATGRDNLGANNRRIFQTELADPLLDFEAWRERTLTSEIVGSTETIYRLLELDNWMGSNDRLFRLPGGMGANNARVGTYFSRIRARNYAWNIDSLDYNDTNPLSIVDRVQKAMIVNGKGIVLFHDIHPQAIEASRLLIESWKMNPAVKIVPLPLEW